MDTFWQCVTGGRAGAPEGPGEVEAIAAALGAALGAAVYPSSVAAAGGAALALARRDLERSLVLAWPAGAAPAAAGEFTGRKCSLDLPVGRAAALEVRRDAAAAAALRRALPWTGPQAVAGRPSIGLGDRLGLATPGHIRAVRGTGYVPMLAQQSIREMTRTQRSPQEVLDDATWGVFQMGFRSGFGADADHLKTAEDVDRCAAAGFTFFTIDPGDHVEDGADGLGAAALAARFSALPWDALETRPLDLTAAYVGKTLDAGGQRLAFDGPTLHRAAVKYGRAVAHTAALYRHLAGRLGEGRFELEVSVDETASPTTPAEHLFVARELGRMGARWAGLAPRFVGRFEKGVDYMGDLEDLERTFQAHLAVAAASGGYKLSLHSGSDKFSVYEMAARHGGERVHVKTAGTSYLEALRVLAAMEPGLFREVLSFARGRYETDKATYHVSADLGKVPAEEELADEDLVRLLDEFHARQVLHVTFGSVLTAEDGARFRRRMLEALKRHEAAYEEALEKHIRRHLAPFLANP